MQSEKLQKVLARAGLGSRREMETWIATGRVSVNGTIATLGDRVSGEEKIRVDGKLLKLIDQTTTKTKVLIYNKPEGEICTKDDPEGRASVFTNLPKLKHSRWIMVGRLDINTRGLLLFTDNGELAYRLMHPSYQIEREYASRIKGTVEAKMLNNLCTGIKLEDGMAKFEFIKDAGGEGLNHWYHVMLKEGRNREVRRLWESQNLTVSRLIRIRFANIALPRHLRRGQWEYLDDKSVKNLYELVKLD